MKMTEKKLWYLMSILMINLYTSTAIGIGGISGGLYSGGGGGGAREGEPMHSVDLVNDSGHEISAYLAGCKDGKNQKIKYLEFDTNKVKEIKLDKVCFDKLMAHKDTETIIWHGGGTISILYQYEGNVRQEYPRLYQLGNPQSLKYHFNPKSRRSKKNPVQVQDGKALTVQFPDPNKVSQAGGFWLETTETKAARITKKISQARRTNNY